jgi:hypothetical protein
MIKLMNSEIEAIARDVIDRVFEGSSVVGAPLSIVADTEWGDPDFVDVQIVHQVEPIGYDAQRRAEAMSAIRDIAWSRGDHRYFGVSGDYSLIKRPAA